MNTLVLVLSWVFAIWLVGGSLASVSLVGKPRKPLTPGIAVGSILISLSVAWLLVGTR